MQLLESGTLDFIFSLKIPFAITLKITGFSTVYHLSEVKGAKTKTPPKTNILKSLQNKCVLQNENVHYVNIKPPLTILGNLPTKL